MPSALFADGDDIFVNATLGGCSLLLSDFTTATIVPAITIQDVATPNTVNICSGNDGLITINGSEPGVTYEALVNGSQPPSAGPDYLLSHHACKI